MPLSSETARAAPAAFPSEQAPAGPPVRVGMLIGSLAAPSGGPVVVVRCLSNKLHHAEQMDVEVFSLREADVRSAPEGWPDIPLTLTKIHGPKVFGYSPALPGSLRVKDLD